MAPVVLFAHFRLAAQAALMPTMLEASIVDSFNDASKLKPTVEPHLDRLMKSGGF